MKQLLLILTCCFYFMHHNLFAQNYVAEFLSEKNNCRLTFNASTWRYDVTTSMEFTVESKDIDLDNDNSSSAVSITTFNFRSLVKNEYLDVELLFGSSSGLCVIRGELIKPDWTILSDSVKTIENYTCLMAKGHVRGRDYTVWFTPDIPVSAGPWKLWGLPGLIVSARSDDGVVGDITMISLKQTDNPPQEPVVKETVSHEEFKSLFQEGIKKFRRTLQSLATSETADIDVSVSVGQYPDKSLFE